MKRFSGSLHGSQAKSQYSFIVGVTTGFDGYAGSVDLGSYLPARSAETCSEAHPISARSTHWHQESSITDRASGDSEHALRAVPLLPAEPEVFAIDHPLLVNNPGVRVRCCVKSTLSRRLVDEAFDRR